MSTKTNIFILATIGDGIHYAISRYTHSQNHYEALTVDGEWITVDEGSSYTPEQTFSDQGNPKVVELGRLGDYRRFMVVRTQEGTLQALQLDGGWIERPRGFIASQGEIFEARS